MMPPDPFAQRYTKLRLVGRGGFGAVYRASDVEMEREVALKLLNPDLAADADWRRRFRLEATAASKLNHANITIVFDRGEFDGQPFIVMEFVEGDTLSKVIDQGVLLSDYERIALLEQLCDGLHYAHQRDIVHRDIKPVNLVVREDDDGTHRVRTLKILDFGIAKVVNAGQTATGGMMFTPSYVSPEQVLGEEVDRRSDIFAVGAVAYELLAGEKAFPITSKNPFAVLEEVKRKIVQEPHRPLSEARPDLDPELSAIVDRALAKAPADRYRDLAEMRRRLRKVRERLEEAVGGDEATITLAPKIQAAVRLARQALEAGDATLAVAHLEDAAVRATTDWERQFLQTPLAEALERQAAARAERKAHDEAAAQAAISMAANAFVEGDRTAAIRTLGQFEPHDLVAEQLRLLQHADAAIVTAERSVEAGDERERAQALATLESFEPADLVSPAVVRLRQRADERLDAEQRAAAAEAVRRTYGEFASGRRAEAIADLETFPEPARVAPTLERLRDADRAIGEAETRVRQGDRRDRAAAIDRLAQFRDATLVAGPLAALRAVHADRNSAEEDAAERARRADQEAAWADSARKAVDSARAAFAAGRRDDAVAQLVRFERPDLVADARADLGALAGLVARVAARVADGGPTVRVRALEELAAAGRDELLAPVRAALTETHLNRVADERRAAEEARARDELGERARQAQIEARQVMAGGDPARALQILERFTPPELVAGTLAALRDALQAIEAATATVNAESASATARRGAIEQLARREPRDLFERPLAALREADQKRSAAEAKAEGERREREAQALLETQKADAARVAAAAKAQFVQGSHDRALQTLAGFEPAALVADMAAQLRRAKTAIDTARAAVARADAAGRQRAIASLREFPPAELVATAGDQLQADHERRTADEQRAELARQADAQANRTIAEARRLSDAGNHGAAMALLERGPSHPAVEAALEELRVTLRVRELLDRAEGELAGNLTAAAATVEEARRLRPGDERVKRLTLNIAARRRAARMQTLRRVGIRLAPAVAAVAIAVIVYMQWPLVRPRTGTDTRVETPPSVTRTGPDPATGTGNPPPPPKPPVPPTPTMVTIDATPWARFSITPTASDSGQQPVTGVTPARIQLLPGTYTISLQNDGVTGPVSGSLVVGDSPLAKEFQMSGFSADRAVDAILGPERPDEGRK
jgi:hypothetical protein